MKEEVSASDIYHTMLLLLLLLLASSERLRAVEISGDLSPVV